MKTILGILFFLAVTTSVVFAYGDIVYSARYYWPPGSKGKSGFHLYRINPDGTGKRQITFSTADDDHPQWSPDGKSILFERTLPSKSDDNSRMTLCLISAQGGAVIKLLDMGSTLDAEWSDEHWSPDGHTISIRHEIDQKTSRFSSLFLLDVPTRKIKCLVDLFAFEWSSDGKHAIISNDQGYGIYDINSGKIVTLKDFDKCPTWIDRQTLADLIVPDDQATMTVHFLGLDGQTLKQTKCRFTKDYPGSRGEAIAGDGTLLATPDPQRPIYVYNAHSSTVPVDYVYFGLNFKTQTMHYFTEGQFLAWSPDGKRFCTAPGRDTVPYERRRYPQPYLTPGSMEARYRTVWAAPLFIRATNGGPMHQLTPRLSWVTGADWRKKAINT